MYNMQNFKINVNLQDAKDNNLTFKINESIDSNIKANNTKLILLNVNLLSYILLR